MEDGFLLTGVFLFVLFLLLGSGVWVALALLGVAFVGMELFTDRPAGDAMITTIWTSRPAGGRRHDHDDLDLVFKLDADRPAAVHLDGRNPVSNAAKRRHVPRLGAMGGETAWRAFAYQCYRLHNIRCRVGLVGRDADHGWQDVDP
jgi:hypothetical protein